MEGPLEQAGNVTKFREKNKIILKVLAAFSTEDHQRKVLKNCCGFRLQSDYNAPNTPKNKNKNKNKKKTTTTTWKLLNLTLYV